MAKLAFTKLGLKRDDAMTALNYGEQTIEVKKYLPVEKKLELIAYVLNNSTDDIVNNFANPMKIEVYTILGLIKYYTNINFTEKQEEDPQKLYDLIKSNRLDAAITNCVAEWGEVEGAIQKTIKSYYKYNNSALGILENISTDYSNLNLDATEIQQKLADPENMTLLRNVLSKMG